jgi:hypothetical protein
VKHTPFGLNSEEHPHPAPSDFEEHEDEQTAFGFGKPCETRHHAPQPRETEDKIRDDDVVVQPVRVEVAVPPKTVRVITVTAFGGEEGKVPILDHIPPEGVAGVNEGEDESAVN